jgi:hypothetical protein
MEDEFGVHVMRIHERRNVRPEVMNDQAVFVEEF